MIDLSDTPLPTLPKRNTDSHKGDYGRALIVGGSLGMAGAPALAGIACLRSGAGLVMVATPRCVQATVAGHFPAYTTTGLADDGERLAHDAGAALQELSKPVTAGAIGPGIGQSTAITALVSHEYGCVEHPLVIDADGLNALAADPPTLSTTGGPRVLTPHAGEFARLRGQALDDPNNDQARREGAAELAQRDQSGRTVVLLKGPRTVVTDGERYAVNTTGNAGMATGGTGDVLTGVITALLCQGLDAFDAARLGAHAHGLAGDLAAAKLGEMSLTAVDLVDSLSAAWLELTA